MGKDKNIMSFYTHGTKKNNKTTKEKYILMCINIDIFVSSCMKA